MSQRPPVPYTLHETRGRFLLLKGRLHFGGLGLEPRRGVGVYKVATATRANPRTVVVGRPGAFEVRWPFLSPLFAPAYFLMQKV